VNDPIKYAGFFQAEAGQTVSALRNGKMVELSPKEGQFVCVKQNGDIDIMDHHPLSEPVPEAPAAPSRSRLNPPLTDATRAPKHRAASRK